jgi:hypothetical protein
MQQTEDTMAYDEGSSQRVVQVRAIPLPLLASLQLDPIVATCRTAHRQPGVSHFTLRALPRSNMPSPYTGTCATNYIATLRAGYGSPPRMITYNYLLVRTRTMQDINDVRLEVEVEVEVKP